MCKLCTSIFNSITFSHRILPEEAAPSQYEMKSVVMSTTGFLTPTRGQGKLPDSRTPPPPTPGTTSTVLNLTPLLQAPDSPSEAEVPPAVFTETVQDQNIMEDNPDYNPDDIDSLNSSSASNRFLKKDANRIKGKGRAKGRGKGRSPKQSPGRSKSPKGRPVKPKELFAEPLPVTADEHMDGSPDSPKLLIDEEKALQREAAEAREMRLQAYDSTIDDVIKRVMSQDEDEDEMPGMVQTGGYSPIKEGHPNPMSLLQSPPVVENEEERERRRQLEVTVLT